MLAIVSVGIANLLILQRVVILWEHRPVRACLCPPPRVHTHRPAITAYRALLIGMTSVWQIILKIMTVGFLVSFITQVVTMIVTLINILREFTPHVESPCICSVLIL